MGYLTNSKRYRPTFGYQQHFLVSKHYEELEISAKIFGVFVFTAQCTFIQKCPHVTTEHFQNRYRLQKLFYVAG